MEDARALVEAELNRVTALADLLAGAPAIEPAPAADALALGSGAP
jgi:hypothetical protein